MFLTLGLILDPSIQVFADDVKNEAEKIVCRLLLANGGVIDGKKCQEIRVSDNEKYQTITTCSGEICKTNTIPQKIDTQIKCDKGGSSPQYNADALGPSLSISAIKNHLCAKANCFDYIVNASQESYLEESKLSGNQEKLLDAWKDYTLVYFPIVDRNQYKKDSIDQIQRTIT